jgi:uncharacterized NAD(P)/FAD-binding protein YdhS
MKKSPRQRIAIIGGGFAGAVTALKLIESSDQALDLQLFESSHEIGRGIAYSSRNHAHLLNGPARLFGLYPQQPDHLVNWLSANAHAYDWQPPAGISFANCFAPRWLFGAYVQATLQAALQQSGTRVSLQTVQQRVTDLQRHAHAGHYLITSATGSQWQADRVVLATGLFRAQTQQAFAVDPALLQPPSTAPADTRLIENVWHDDAWRDIAQAQTVLIIGSSLTALDAILSAEQHGFTGRYIALSRRGLQLSPREDLEPWPDLLQPQRLPTSLRTLLRTVQQARHAIRASGESWQRLPGAVRPYLPQLWANASTRDRQRFLRHLRPYWEIALHRAAPESSRAFAQIVASGRYLQQSGRISALRAAADGQIEVKWRGRGGQAVPSMLVDRVINAQGYEFDWRKIDDALLVSILQRGLVSVHSTGYGIDTVATSGAVRNAAGDTSDSLFAVGHPVRGVVWESNSIAEQLAGATATAQAIAALIARPAHADASLTNLLPA